MVACGVLLVPVAGAQASHRMPNGTLCPHAAGEGPNAQPPSSQPAAPARTGSTAPLGNTPRSAPPAPPPAAKPATQVKAQQPASKPATQQPASRPATQIKAQQPASTQAQRAPVRAVSQKAVSSDAVASTPRPQRAVTPTARGKQDRNGSSKPATSERRAVTPASEKDFAPPVTRPSTAPLPAVERVNAVSQRDVPATAVVALLSLLGLGVLGGAAMFRRRRGAAGAAVAIDAAPQAPRDPVAVAQATHAANVEAALHEMIAEVRARELLETEAGEGADDDSLALSSH